MAGVACPDIAKGEHVTCADRFGSIAVVAVRLTG